MTTKGPGDLSSNNISQCLLKLSVLCSIFPCDFLNRFYILDVIPYLRAVRY